MEILIIQTAFLGDLLLSLPLILGIRKKYPQAKLTLLCRHGFGSSFEKIGVVDEVLEVKKTSRENWQKTKEHLTARSFHRIFCPHYSTRTQLLVSSLKADKKIGFRNLWNFFVFTDRVSRPMALPDALRQLSLLTADDPEFAKSFREWVKKNSQIKNVKSLASLQGWGSATIPEWANMALPNSIQGDLQFPINKKTIVLAPASQWRTKQWPEIRFADLGCLLLEKGYSIALSGGPKDKYVCEAVAKGMLSQVPSARDRIFNMSGEMDVYSSMVHFKASGGMVTNDSGSMHMASVADIPTVAVFGPTVLQIGFRPWNQKSAVAQVDLPCRPCGKHGSDRCPLGTHACMTDVSARHVFELTKSLF